MDSAKIDVILTWSCPRSASKVQSFLQLADYYPRFVEGFSSIVSPLTNLTRNETKFESRNQHKEGFQKLKEKLTSTSVLEILRSGERFTIYSDASHQGLGWGCTHAEWECDSLWVKGIEDL